MSLSRPASPQQKESLEIDNINTKNKLNAVIEKMLKMHQSFFAPFNRLNRDYYMAWLTVGAGKNFEAEIYRFSNELKLILSGTIADEYKEAIEGEDFVKDGVINFSPALGLQCQKTELLVAFFTKHPTVLDFFAKELCHGISQLECADNAFREFENDLKNPIGSPLQPKKAATTANNQAATTLPRNKSPIKTHTTSTVMLMLRDNQPMKISVAEYTESFLTLNRVTNEHHDVEQPLITTSELSQAVVKYQQCIASPNRRHDSTSIGAPSV
jgi:hypothetical protein